MKLFSSITNKIDSPIPLIKNDLISNLASNTLSILSKNKDDINIEYLMEGKSVDLITADQKKNIKIELKKENGTLICGNKTSNFFSTFFCQLNHSKIKKSK